MIEYRIGKRFPHEIYLGKGDVNVAILTNTFFNTANILSNITEAEKSSYKDRKLTVSLFEKDNIPFIIFSLEGWGFDANINVARLNKEQLDLWVDSEANAITLQLVEATTGLLEVLRMIAIPMEMSRKIKDICKAHSDYDPEVVDNHIAMINATIPADVMIKNAIMSYTFEGK